MKTLVRVMFGVRIGIPGCQGSWLTQIATATLFARINVYSPMDTEENIARSREMERQTKEAGLAFLKTDAEAALTFAGAALQAGRDSEKKTRNQANARKGYDSILHLSKRIAPLCTEAEKQELGQKLQQLRDALEQLGEIL